MTSAFPDRVLFNKEQYSTEVRNELNKFTPHSPEEVAQYKEILKSFLNQETTVHSQVLKSLQERSVKLLELADRVILFKNPWEKALLDKSFKEEINKKIRELEHADEVTGEARNRDQTEINEIVSIYSSLIDPYFDAFPIQSLEEIEHVIHFLRSLVAPDNYRMLIDAKYLVDLVGFQLLSKPQSDLLNLAILKSPMGGPPVPRDSNAVDSFLKLILEKAKAKLYALEVTRNKIIVDNLFKNEKANYVELINEHLDRFPTEKLDDFQTNRQLFASLLDSDLQVQVSEQMQDRYDSLRDLLREPELFVKPENEEQFKELVMQRIRQTIQQIDLLTPEEKERCIRDYRAAMEERHRGQEILAAAALPTREQSTISYEEMIDEMGVTPEELREILFDASLAEENGLTWLRERAIDNPRVAEEYRVQDLYQPAPIVISTNLRVASRELHERMALQNSLVSFDPAEQIDPSRDQFSFLTDQEFQELQGNLREFRALGPGVVLPPAPRRLVLIRAIASAVLRSH